MPEEQINLEKRARIKKYIVLGIGVFVGLQLFSKGIFADIILGEKTNTDTRIANDLYIQDKLVLANGLKGQYLAKASNTDYDNTWKDTWEIGSDNYMEYTQVGDKITQVDYWTNSGKGTKLFTKAISYTGEKPTTITLTNEQNSRVQTTTIAYSGETITNVTKVVS